MSVHQNPFNYGMGARCHGCETDHGLAGGACCTTHFGPGLPDLTVGPITSFAPFTGAQKMQILRSKMSAKTRGFRPGLDPAHVNSGMSGI